MLNTLRDVLFRRLFRARFRYDVFISYSHRDCKEYAANLRKQLGNLDFSCFIDEEESPPGSSLDPTLAKALKKSAVLVLLATERALTRPYIVSEFEKFAPTERIIVPINLLGALTRNEEEALSRSPWNIIKTRKLIWIDEADEAFAKGMPSPPIADGIDKLFKYTRRNSRVRTEIIATAALVLVAAMGAGLVIKGKAAEVSKQAQLADNAKKETVKQLGIATDARREADTQLALARKAAGEAERLGKVADTAKKEAEHQQEIARTATAEADKQLAIASAAKAEAKRQQAIAEAQLQRSRHLLYDSDMNLAQSAYETGDMGRVSQLLDAHSRAAANSNQTDLRGFDWFYLWRLSNNEQKRHDGYAGPLAFSPNGRTLAIESSDHTLKLRDPVTQEDKVLPGLTGPLHALLFSPDGRFLITDEENQIIRIWDLSTNPQKSIATLREARPAPITRGERRAAMIKATGVADIPVSFSQDGKTLAVWSGDTVKLWDTAAWREETAPKLDLPAAISVVSFSPDGKLLAIQHDGFGEFWDLRESVPKKLEMLKTEFHNVASIVAFSPDSKMLVTENRDDEVRLWDLSAGTPRERALLEKARWHLFAAFSPDGKRLILVDYDGTVEVWDTTVEKPERAKTLSVDLGRDANQYPSVTLSPDGNTMAIEKGNGTIKLLSLKMNDSSLLNGELATLRIPGGGEVKFSPDNNSLAVVNQSGTMKVWDLGRGSEPGLLKGHAAAISNLDFSPDGTTLLVVSKDKTLKVWDMTANLLSPVSHSVDFYLLCQAFSPDGKRLAVGGSDGARLFETGVVKDSMLLKRIREDHVHAVAFSPDGDTLAIGGGSGVKLWHAGKPAEEPKPLGSKKGIVMAVTFSADGALLAAVYANGDVEIWDRNNLENPKSMKVRSSTSMAAFSLDHRTLITSANDGELRLWDVEGSKEPRTLAKEIKAVSLTPDGKTIVAVNRAGQVKLWDTNKLLEQQTIDLNSTDIGAVALSNDGKVLATSVSGLVTLRDISTGQVLASLDAPGDWHNYAISSLAFSFDGQTLVAGSRAGLTFWYAATKEEVIGSQPIKN
jgi:WD40 repeat protein